MIQSRKRRPSMSPSDVVENKKRKYNNLASASKPSTSSGSRARSPGPVASDSSTTLDGSTSPSRDKGKAVEKDPLILELDRLRQEVARKNELLERREKTLAAVTQTLTCQICLELLDKPYALAPCGHVSCHSCLVSWFTAPHNDPDADEDLPPNARWFSEIDTASSVSEEPIFDEDPPPPDTHPNPPPDAGDNGLPVPPVNGNPPPPGTRRGYPNSVYRRKTCPHCRCIVQERPVQVYILKDLVGIVDTRADSLNGENDTRDPWKRIFHPLPGPGPGSNHGPDHGGEDAPAVHVPIGDLPRFAAGPHIHTGLGDGGDESFDDPDFFNQPLIDAEDGVRRCVHCFHEIWHGECTNRDCGVIYDGASGASSPSSALGLHFVQYNGEEDETEITNSDGEDDDGYESSFIDDEESRGELQVRSGDLEDDDFIPGPARRLTEDTVIHTISDDDDLGPSTRTRRLRRRRIVVDPEEEVDVSSGDSEDDGFIPGPVQKSTSNVEDSGPSASTRRLRRRRIVDDPEEDASSGNSQDNGFILGPARRSTENVQDVSHDDEDPGLNTRTRRLRRRRWQQYRGWRHRRIVDELSAEVDEGSEGNDDIPPPLNVSQSATVSVNSFSVVDEDENFTGVPYVWEEDGDESQDREGNNGEGDGDSSVCYAEVIDGDDRAS